MPTPAPELDDDSSAPARQQKQPPVEGERTVTLIAISIALLILAIIAWRVATRWSGVESFFAYVADRPDEIWERTKEHIYLTVASITTATIISVPLGIAVMNNAPLRNIALTVSGVLLTVPSLAFFAILIPIVGIGFGPPYISLTIYAILPILRNTITGLGQVDPAVLESAKGMGLSRFQRIKGIQLPLAWPVILTGIRVATILTISIAAIAILVRGGGLGAFIQNGLNRFGFPGHVESIWTGTLFTILLALVFERAFALLSRLTTSKGLR